MLSPQRRGRLRAVWLGVSALSLSAANALAEPAPSFPDLLRSAQTSAPRLAEARANIARAEGLARQAGAWPNPTLGVDVENFGGSGPYRGSDFSETTASVSQTIELGGKRGARVSVGRAEVEAARRKASEALVQFAVDLADAYARAEAAERRLSLATDALALAEGDARIALALVEAGREADLRSVQARAAVQLARATVDEARAARAMAFGALTSLSGSPVSLTAIPVSLLARADGPAALSAPDPLASPAYLTAQAEREAVSRRIRIERLRAVPDVSVSVGVRRFQQDGSTAVVAGLSTPFPLFDRNRGAVSAANADLAAAEARLNAARLGAEAEALSSLARINASASRLAAAREAEATAEEAYRLSRLGYEGGKLPLVELLNARRALTEAHAQALDATLDRLSALAALARLQGRAPFGDQP